MSEEPDRNSERATSFARRIGAKASRKLAARRNPSRIWFGLGMMGLIGWSVVMPTLLGAAIGAWLDTRHAGQHSWTLALLVAGLALGCFSAWRWVVREQEAMRGGRGDADE